jgi:hypothetical protein
MLARMAVMPFLLFPAVLVLAGTLAIVHRRDRPRLAWANLALAFIAALLIVNEAIMYRLRSAIRVDLLLTLPALSLGAVAVGALAIRGVRSSARVLAIVLVTCCGAAIIVYGTFFVRTSIDAAKQTRQFFTGNRLYWEETIRCQEALIERFGTLDREGDPCTGNLRVTSRTGGYPFTRVIVNERRDVYLMFSPEGGVETVYGLEGTWPLRGKDTSEGMTADGVQHSGVRMIETRRRSQHCEANITQENGSSNSLQLAREQLPLCPVVEKPPVRLAGVWSSTLPIGPQHARLVQLWLWTSQTEAWAMLLDSTGVRGQERRFNFVKRFRGKPSAGVYELRPYSNLDGESSIAITVHAGSAQLELSDPKTVVVLDKSGQLTDPRIRLAPLYDIDRFTVYFDSVLRLVDIPWTPASSP